MKNTYSTGQVVDILSVYKSLEFEVIGGLYDGGVVHYDIWEKRLLWHDNSEIIFNDELLKSHWKLICKIPVKVKLYDPKYLYAYAGMN